MASNTGNLTLSSDLQAWYTALNTIIQNYGGGVISQMSIPTANKEITTSDLNTYLNKMDEMKADEYLSHGSYPSYSVTSTGSLIRAAQGTVLPDATNNTYLGRIICRNQATNTVGACNSGSKSHGSNTCGSNSCGSKSSTNKQNTNCTSGAKGSFTYDGGNHNVNHNFGGKNSGYVYAFATKTPVGSNTNGSNSCGSNSCGSHSSGSCTSGTCNSGPNTSYGAKGSGTVIDLYCTHTTKSNG